MTRSSAAATLHRVLLSEYYVASIITIATYAWLRFAYHDADIQIKSVSLSTYMHDSSQKADSFGTWEWRVFIVCAATAAYRIYNVTSSMHGACFTAVGFAQVFVAAMAFLVDKTLFGHYVAVYALSYLLLEQPQIEQPQEIEALTPVTLKGIQDATTAEPGVAYLVFLHAPWSLTCRHTFSTFAQLAARYSTERLRFRKLDVGEWPHVARALGVEVSAGNSQLPTLILYEGGAEVARLPQRSSTSGRELRKENMIRAFELDMRLATSLQPGDAGKGAAAAAAAAAQKEAGPSGEPRKKQ